MTDRDDLLGRVLHQPRQERLVELVLVGTARVVLVEARVLAHLCQPGRLEELHQLDAGCEAELHVAVPARINPDGVPLSRLPVALTLQDVPGQRPHRRRVLVERREALEVGDLDGLAAAAQRADPQRGDRPDECVRAGLVRDVQPRPANRFARGLAVRVELPADRLVGEEVRAEQGVRTGAAERRDPRPHEPAVPRPIRPGRQRPRRRVLDHRIRIRQQLGQPGIVALLEHQRSLRGVQVGPGRANRVAARERPRRALGTERIATRRFDLDYGRAIVGEYPRGVGASL